MLKHIILDSHLKHWSLSLKMVLHKLLQKDGTVLFSMYVKRWRIDTMKQTDYHM